MKNLNSIVNVILAIAVIILFVLHFTQPKEDKRTVARPGLDSMQVVLPIAYVNVDSLLINYVFSQELNENILRRQETSRANITQKARALQADMADFEKKIQNNAFLSEQRARQEQERLLKKRQELEELDARLSQELLVEQQKMYALLKDTIDSQLKRFNKTQGYQVIFSNSNGENILFAEKVYDITQEVINYLNKNYLPSAGDKKD